MSYDIDADDGEEAKKRKRKKEAKKTQLKKMRVGNYVTAERKT